jgi:hypothetical protein
MTCSNDLRKDVDDPPAQVMMAWVGHAPNGGVIFARGLSWFPIPMWCQRPAGNARFGARDFR